MQGSKFDDKKVPLDLIAWDTVWETARVLAFGRIKYDSWNWYKGIQITRLLAGALRHITQFMVGYNYDSESKLCHLAHAQCMIMFAMQQWMEGRNDDRMKFLPKLKEGGVDNGDKKCSSVTKDPTSWTPNQRESVPRYGGDYRETGRKSVEVWDDEFKYVGDGTPDMQQELLPEPSKPKQDVCPCDKSHPEDGWHTETKLLVHGGNVSKAQAQRLNLREDAVKQHCTVFGQRR
jgi:hypothetical protein